MTNAAAKSRGANVSSRTVTMAETALLVAVTIIMGTTPLGTIRTPFLSVSLVTVPVAIAAMLIGPVGAIVCGTVFGITSFINAVTGTSGLLSALFQISPFGVFVTAVIARLLDGLFTGLIFRALHRVTKGKSLSYYLTGLAAPLLNTLFFMGSLILFFYHTDYIQNMASKLGTAGPFSFVVALVGVQGLIEAAVGCALAGTVGYLLAKALHRS